eukprot:11806352-Alexandrium_andersonii.AAC.1
MCPIHGLLRPPCEQDAHGMERARPVCCVSAGLYLRPTICFDFWKSDLYKSLADHSGRSVLVRTNRSTMGDWG